MAEIRLVVVRGRKKLVVGCSWLEVGRTPRQVSRRDLYNVTEITDKLAVTAVAQLYKLTERPPRQKLETGAFCDTQTFLQLNVFKNIAGFSSFQESARILHLFMKRHGKYKSILTVTDLLLGQ